MLRGAACRFHLATWGGQVRSPQTRDQRRLALTKPHRGRSWTPWVPPDGRGSIMGVQALSDPAERGHLVGDVPALILVAIVLAVLMPRGLHKVESGPHTVPA